MGLLRISNPPLRRITTRKWIIRTTLILTLPLPFALFTRAQDAAAPAKCPPPARLDSAKDTYGATVVADSYRYLEDQESPETRAWIAAEQECTDAALSKLPGRAALSKRLSELLHHDSFEVPVERGGRYFFHKRLAGQDLSTLYVRRGLNAPDQVLIDPLPWTADHSASVTLENVSRDGKFVLYGRRDGGQDEVTPHVLNIDTLETLPDAFPKSRYDAFEFSADNKTVYYSLVTPEGSRVYIHHLGEDFAKDQLVFGKGLSKDKGIFLLLSQDGAYLIYVIVYGSGSERSELYVQNVKDNGPIVAAENTENAIFNPSLAGDQLLILSNSKASQWRVFSTSLATPQREHWRELIPEGKLHLESITAVGGKLLGQYTNNAASELHIFDASGKQESAVALPSLGSVGATSGHWESPELFFSFESYDFSPAIFRYDVRQPKPEVWAKDKIQFDAAALQVEQVWFTSKDGTRVPMFLFHKKGLKMDGSNPVLMTGYGGFDISETPYYQSNALIWAEHGGIFADVTLRGGGEFGEDWHRAGMFGKKQTVFDDFIAAAQFLIANKYTSSSKLAIDGTSNGGLLVGAALTQRPDLYQAVVCGYPLLDMLRFQKFLEGPYWVSEYGSTDDLSQFQYLYDYSPYQHVVDGKKYPSVLFVTGDGDTRVAPLHARKMAARLQAAAANAPDHPILLLYDTKSGHSGGRPINKIVEEGTDILSYLFWQLGVPTN